MIYYLLKHSKIVDRSEKGSFLQRILCDISVEYLCGSSYKLYAWSDFVILLGTLFGFGSACDFKSAEKLTAEDSLMLFLELRSEKLYTFVVF